MGTFKCCRELVNKNWLQIVVALVVKEKGSNIGEMGGVIRHVMLTLWKERQKWLKKKSIAVCIYSI